VSATTIIAYRALAAVLQQQGAVFCRAGPPGRNGRREIPRLDAADRGAGGGIDLLALDAALAKREQLDPDQGRIVELRYFGGLSIEETAHAVGASPATVKRHWQAARTWLFDALSGSARIRRRAVPGRACTGVSCSSGNRRGRTGRCGWPSDRRPAP
jgi:hypothetical protein